MVVVSSSTMIRSSSMNYRSRDRTPRWHQSEFVTQRVCQQFKSILTKTASLFKTFSMKFTLLQRYFRHSKIVRFYFVHPTLNCNVVFSEIGIPTSIVDDCP